MTVVTDDYMRDILSKSKAYTVVLLKATPKLSAPGSDAVVWEHGRRNLSLRADGLLAIILPITDGSGWSGVAVFDADSETVAGIMNDDPGVQAGIFSYEIHGTRSFPGDALP